jgi:elongation factor G
MREFNRQSRPIISVAIGPTDYADRESLQRALADLAQHDPAIAVELNRADDRIILSGVSESHLEETCRKIARVSKIGIEIGEPQAIYLETICKPAEAEGKYIRQTGGSGNYGHVKLRLEPLDPGLGYQFTNETLAGAIPPQFVGPIDAGIQSARMTGILTGHEMVDLRAILLDGSYNAEDSNEMAFQFAASIAFKEAARKASPILLEPVMSVEIAAPEEFMGAIIGDLNCRRGRIEGIKHRAGSTEINASVPLAEMIGYDVRAFLLREGPSSCSMQFARYEKAPRKDWLGGDETGMTARKPNRPSAGSGAAAARPDDER